MKSSWSKSSRLLQRIAFSCFNLVCSMLYQLDFSKVLEKVIKNYRVFSKILKREIFYNMKTRKSIAFSIYATQRLSLNCYCRKKRSVLWNPLKRLNAHKLSMNIFRSSHRTCSLERCSQRFGKIHRKTLVSIKKETVAQVFPCEFCEIFKRTFSYRVSPCDSAFYL